MPSRAREKNGGPTIDEHWLHVCHTYTYIYIYIVIAVAQEMNDTRVEKIVTSLSTLVCDAFARPLIPKCYADKTT